MANNFLKSTGVISKFGKYISNVGLAVSTVASSLVMASQAMETQVVHSTTLVVHLHTRRTVCTWSCFCKQILI